MLYQNKWVSKLFRAYRLYNNRRDPDNYNKPGKFQSSFELTGYITKTWNYYLPDKEMFQSSFELTGYITNRASAKKIATLTAVSKLFRAYGLYNSSMLAALMNVDGFQSSFELTGYITI